MQSGRYDTLVAGIKSLGIRAPADNDKDRLGARHTRAVTGSAPTRRRLNSHVSAPNLDPVKGTALPISSSPTRRSTDSSSEHTLVPSYGSHSRAPPQWHTSTASHAKSSATSVKASEPFPTFRSTPSPPLPTEPLSSARGSGTRTHGVSAQQRTPAHEGDVDSKGKHRTLEPAYTQPFADDGENVLLNIAMVGDACVGKTSLMTSYVEGPGSFDPHYTDTIGFNRAEKRIRLRNIEVTLNVMDLGGQSDFVSMLPLVCKEAVAVLFCFDLSRKTTLNSTKDWYRQARGFNKAAVPIMIGTKYDVFSHFSIAEQEKIAAQAMRISQAMKAPLVFTSASMPVSTQASPLFNEAGFGTSPFDGQTFRPGVPLNVHTVFRLVLAKVFGLDLRRLAGEVEPPSPRDFRYPTENDSQRGDVFSDNHRTREHDRGRQPPIETPSSRRSGPTDPPPAPETEPNGRPRARSRSRSRTRTSRARTHSNASASESPRARSASRPRTKSRSPVKPSSSSSSYSARRAPPSPSKSSHSSQSRPAMPPLRVDAHPLPRAQPAIPQSTEVGDPVVFYEFDG